MSKSMVRTTYVSVAPLGGPTEERRPDRSGRHGFLCFTLGDEEYGVDLNLVRQIVKPPPLTWVPRTVPHVLGVISIRGSVVTLIDTRQLMGLPPTTWPRTARVLLIEVDEEAVGLLVDGVSLVRRLPDSALERNPVIDETPHAERVICVARPEPGMQITVIDLGGIVAEALR